MAKPRVYLGNTDVEDLRRIVYKNGCTMLSKSVIENWAIAYNVAPVTVKSTIKRIIDSSFMDKSGKWRSIHRQTMGKIIIIPCLSEIKHSVNLLKTTGQSIDINAIANKYQVSTSFVNSIINEMV